MVEIDVEVTLKYKQTLDINRSDFESDEDFEEAIDILVGQEDLDSHEGSYNWYITKEEEFGCASCDLPCLDC